MRPKVLFLDFDGVVLESADIKTNAFRKMFEKECPDSIDEIIRYYEENGGVSRYIKFEYVYRNFLDRELSTEKSKEMGIEFTEMTLREIETAPFVKGLLDFLNKYHGKIKFIIASGAPHEELNYLVDKRGLRQYFDGAFGAPKKKSQTIADELEKLDLGVEEAIFIGDTLTDYTEAQKAKTHFIGMVGKEKKSQFPDGTDIINDFFELLERFDGVDD
ncbi:HAD-IA family hydrolase [Candidatus Micrarchaeota archaeon]|nr:HAD-IA family hydrolase [Candidatus Micrarchaeota archaeon]MBU1681403.1 HAD-IA family hydrolase [Candidatus Micrarchaeota archaeon]